MRMLLPIVFLLIPLASSAQTTASVLPVTSADNAFEVVDLLGTEIRWTAMMNAGGPTFANSVVAEMQSDPKYASQISWITSHGGIDAFKAALGEDFLSWMKLRYPRLRAALAEYYRANMTANNLADLVRFLTTATGRKFLAIMPGAAASGGQTGASLGAEAGIVATKTALRRIGAPPTS